MTEHANRVRQMIAAGQVSPEQGAELLRSLAPSLAQRVRGWLLDPLEHASTTVALLVTALVGALGVVVAVSVGVRFDGALDMHVTNGSVTLGAALIDQLVALPLTILIGVAAARLAKATPRLEDMAGAVGVARVPLLLSALVTALLPRPHIDPAHPELLLSSPTELMKVIPIVALVLPVSLYFFVLLFRNYRTATGLSGQRLWVSFISWIVVAEVASKALLVLT
jgi:hypothetical protein